MIAIDTKNYILDKYYNEHEKTTTIAKELDVNLSYITKIIKNDTRYIQEKEYKTQEVLNISDMKETYTLKCLQTTQTL